jgi:hypothetical protein
MGGNYRGILGGWKGVQMNKAGEQILLHRIKSLEWLIDVKTEQVYKLETALKRIRDCEWVITLPDRMDAVRAIAREALE